MVGRLGRVGFVTAGCSLAIAIVSLLAWRSGGDGRPLTRTTATTSSSRRATGAPVAKSERPASQRYEAALPVPVQEAAAAVSGDRLFVVGGYDAARNSTVGVFVLDGTRWSRGPSLPIALNHPGAATIDQSVYVAGGFTPTGATNRLFVLGSGATSWRELAPMRRRRGALSLLSVDGRLVAVGGRDGAGQIAVPELYDPHAGVWTDLPAMPAPRNHTGGYVDGPLACVAGGRTPQTSAAIDCVNPTTGVWTPRASLPLATSGAAAMVLWQAILVAGGEPAQETNLVGVIQTYASRRWTNEPMLVPRHGTAFAIYRGRLWLCGGAVAPGFAAVATCTSLAG